MSQHSQHQSSARICVPSGPFGLAEQGLLFEHFFLFQIFRQGGNAWNLFDFDNQSAAVFCVDTIKYYSIPSVPSGLEGGKTRPHSGITLTVFAMSESPKFHQITKKCKSRIEKRKDRLVSRSTAYFLRNTEKRYPYVTTTAAQQQLSSSSAAAAAQQKQQRRRWWWWRRRRRRRRRRRQHGKPFFCTASCRSSTVVHQKERRDHKNNMVDTSSYRLMYNTVLGPL